ncbi:hypothetical protein HYQ46_009730 [Verticillium longisporum]|nr:hypothetical protein HYQ46_009730 [Verticillium longisporum]
MAANITHSLVAIDGARGGWVDATTGGPRLTIESELGAHLLPAVVVCGQGPLEPAGRSVEGPFGRGGRRRGRHWLGAGRSSTVVVIGKTLSVGEVCRP